MPERPLTAGDVITTGLLYRRVYPDAFPNGLDKPPSKQAFDKKKEDKGISAYLASECTEDQALDGHNGFALVALDAADVCSAGFVVTYEPTTGPPGHVVITGEFTVGKRRQLAAAVSKICCIGDPDRLRR